MSISTFDLTEYDSEHGYGPEDTNDIPAPPPPATDPQGPKEPRRGPFVNGEVPMRWEFDTLLNDLAASAGERNGEYPVARAALCRAFDALAAERDEWKRRAEATCDECASVEERADKAEAERDAALKRCGVRGLAPNTLRECDEALTLTDDSRIAAWRALDAEQRSYRVEDLRTWADLVEAGAAPDGADHGPSPLRIAAAALEALGEK